MLETFYSNSDAQAETVHTGFWFLAFQKITYIYYIYEQIVLSGEGWMNTERIENWNRVVVKMKTEWLVLLHEMEYSSVNESVKLLHYGMVNNILETRTQYKL